MYKVRRKNDLEDKENRLNRCKSNNFYNCFDIFFTDEAIVYLNNQEGFKLIKNEEQQSFLTGHNRGRKLNVLKAINLKVKWTLHVFNKF